MGKGGLLGAGPRAGGALLLELLAQTVGLGALAHALKGLGTLVEGLGVGIAGGVGIEEDDAQITIAQGLFAVGAGRPAGHCRIAALNKGRGGSILIARSNCLVEQDIELGALAILDQRLPVGDGGGAFVGGLGVIADDRFTGGDSLGGIALEEVTLGEPVASWS